MVPVYLVFKTNGEVWVSNDLVAAKALPNVANVFAIHNAPIQKIATLSGAGSPYTVTPATFDASRNHVQKLQ